MSEQDFPVIEARPTPSGKDLTFFCSHCRKYHTHGGTHAGHRVSHCYKPGSPYRNGYVLVPARESL